MDNKIDSHPNSSGNNIDNDNSCSISPNTNHITLNHARAFWTSILKCPRFILAPMVDQSELAFRLMVRKYGVQCTYTPMIHAANFVRDPKYRKENLQVLPEQDSPCLIQFCANDPDTFLQAAEFAMDHCDAIDLNLGCPQAIAKRGHYGAFLQDDWDLIHRIVSLAVKKLNKPITCKIRVFESIEKTVQYAKMIESAGASLIGVHGRNRDQKGITTGMANWDYIKAVKEALSIPVIANGNIQSYSDAIKCLEYTGADGVMSAEGILYNPSIFSGRPLPVWQACYEYLQIVQDHPCPLSHIRGHIFKFLHACLVLPVHFDLRTIVGKTKSIEELLKVADELKAFYKQDFDEYVQQISNRDSSGCIEPIPPEMYPVFMCKPYYRPSPLNANAESKLNGDQVQNVDIDKTKNKKLKTNDNNGNTKKMNKEKRMAALKIQICHNTEKACQNIKGTKCDFDLCKSCCKEKICKEELECCGHRFRPKPKQ